MGTKVFGNLQSSLTKGPNEKRMRPQSASILKQKQMSLFFDKQLKFDALANIRPGNRAEEEGIKSVRFAELNPDAIIGAKGDLKIVEQTPSVTYAFPTTNDYYEAPPAV